MKFFCLFSTILLSLFLSSCKPEIEVYVITYNSNGGVGEMLAQRFEAETATALQPNAFSKEGSVFQGWSTTSTGSVQYSNQASYIATSDITLYAVWDNNASIYTITFNANGGVGEMPPHSIQEGLESQLPPNSYTRDGYTFSGWSNSANGDVEYEDEEMYSASSDATLYAVWGGTTPEIENMVFVEGGVFEMGSNEFAWTWPIHSVQISSFYIGKYEVTQAQWVAVMGDNPSEFIGDNLPVDKVSWYDAIEFCNALSIIEGFTPYYTIDSTVNDPNNLNHNDPIKWLVTTNSDANGYRLPTEAEWEYAARGGNESEGYVYSGGNYLESIAWYIGNSGGTTHPVGTKQANELGIHDMTGNLWEWCWDWFEEGYNSGTQINPSGPTSGTYKVERGGSWLSEPYESNSHFRYRFDANGQYQDLGFRLARNN